MYNYVLKRRQLPVEFPTFSASIHPLLQKLFALRGIRSEDELDNKTRGLLNFNQLAGIDDATTLLYHAIKKQQRILIVGDFDTDGATSTALMVKALRKMGATWVDYIIPSRFSDGYGLSQGIVDRALANKADLIVTVDNGISAFDAVQYAKDQGLRVIITDHHLAPNELPPADAIVNPNLPYCKFPSKNLAGVGVAFYVMLALRAKMRADNWFIENQIAEYNLAHLLDLVALGTIADVVELDHNNRILVYQGVSRIRSEHCCVGILALIKAAKKQPQKISAIDLSYYLAPRLNAAGRMDNMSLSVELLLSEDDALAFEIAKQLELLNDDRRAIEQTMQQEALNVIAQMANQNEITDNSKNSFVVYHPDWHQGIIGILSARLKDKFSCPVISFAYSDDGCLKGSGRSIEGLHLRDVLDSINIQYPDLMMNFGGHAAAVGLTIKETNYSQFSIAFETAVSVAMAEKTTQKIIETDGAIEPHFMDCHTAILLNESGPWGAGFPEPLFDGQFEVHQQRLIANKHLKLVVSSVEGGSLLDCIFFNIDTTCWPDKSVKKIELVYHLEANEYNNKMNIQLRGRYIRPI